MTHFSTVIVTSLREQEDGSFRDGNGAIFRGSVALRVRVEAEAARLMDPYDENKEVEPYEVPCYCAEHNQLVASRAAAEAATGKTIDALRDSFRDASVPWEEHIRPYREAQERFIAEHPEAKVPDPTCEECHGTGVRETTYNPQSTWDYFTPQEEPSYLADAGTVPAREIKPGANPWAIVLPDGTWLERGRMGWFAIASDEKDEAEWSQTVRGVFAEFADHLVLICDTHI